jgi:galactose mutarotase-like enzyme
MVNPNVPAFAPTAQESIILAYESTRAAIAPGRGGMATRFFVGDRPVFYLDESTLADPSKNVRGGNPVLFPSPGKLEGDQFAHGGHAGAMGQHGFARNNAFEVLEVGADHAVLRLCWAPGNAQAFPWPCTLVLRYRLAAATLRIEQEITNDGPLPMPFGFGFHPYFYVPAANKSHARVPSNATRAFDNTIKQEVELAPIDFGAGEVDLHLIDHDRPDASLLLPDGLRVHLSCSPEYQRWVLWTLPGRDFICVEPWTCPGNALNTQQALLTLPPGETKALSVQISLLE